MRLRAVFELSRRARARRLGARASPGRAALLARSPATAQIRRRFSFPTLPRIPGRSEIPQLPSCCRARRLPTLPGGVQLPNLLPILFPNCREIPSRALWMPSTRSGRVLTQRRNDLLLGLDLGLDRQIDLLADANGDAPPAWGKASGLGGPPMPFGAPMYAVGGSTRSAHPAIRPAFGLWTGGLLLSLHRRWSAWQRRAFGRHLRGRRLHADEFRAHRRDASIRPDAAGLLRVRRPRRQRRLDGGALCDREAFQKPVLPGARGLGHGAQ